MADRQPRFNVVGPVHYFVRIRGDSAGVRYWGTPQKAPRIEKTKMYSDVFNARGGPMVPIQKLYQGEIHRVAALLNRYSNTTVTALNSILSGVPGLENPNHRGKLTFGRESVEVWQIYEFMTNAAQRAAEAPNHPIGRYYPNALIEACVEDDFGTEENKCLFAITCYPLWDSPDVSGSNSFKFTCYSEADAAMTPALQEGFNQ